ncbi:MAG: zinc-ribbon domain containing protein [Chloroflexi bacterium]|nr:zinc-ribbon domain containing protein [Chloroflexota bacterium]
MNRRIAEQQCVDCGQPFQMTPEHVAWFAKKGLDIPRRCKDCRALKKAKRELEPLPKPLLDVLRDAQQLAAAREPRSAYGDLAEKVRGLVQTFGASLRRESYDRLWSYWETRHKVVHERLVPSKAETSDLIAFALSIVDELHFQEPAFQQISEFFKFPNVEHPDWHTEFWARGHSATMSGEEALAKILGHTEADEEPDEEIAGHPERRAKAKPDWTPELRSWPDVLAGPAGEWGESEIALAADVVTLPGDAARRRDVWAECIRVLPAFYICCQREYAFEVLASTEALPGKNHSVLVFYDVYGNTFADLYSSIELTDLRRLLDGLGRLESERDGGIRLELARELIETSSPALIVNSVRFHPVQPSGYPFPIALDDYLWSFGESLLDWYFMHQGAAIGEPEWGQLIQGEELTDALERLIRNDVLTSPERLEALGVCHPSARS